MKTLLFCSLFTVSTITNIFGQSKSYTSFEWDLLRIGYVHPVSSNNQSSGISSGTEVRYNISDDWSFGIGLEGGLFHSWQENEGSDVNVNGVFYLSADKYLSTTSSSRGFAGLNLGYYEDGTINNFNTDQSETIQGQSSMGIAPRFGYEFGHIRVMGQYHYTFKKAGTNYLSINVSVTLWGGYKG